MNQKRSERISCPASMARIAAMIIVLFFSFLVRSDCKPESATRDFHSSLGSSSRRQLRQLAPAPVAPEDHTSYNSIQLVCSATRYPTSCLDALLFDERSSQENYASSPQGLLELLTAIAMERSQVGLADAQTLLATVVPITNNETLTAMSVGCLEILDLAAYYMQITLAALATTTGGNSNFKRHYWDVVRTVSLKHVETYYVMQFRRWVTRTRSCGTVLSLVTHLQNCIT